MPGSGQWRQIGSMKQKCWICQDAIYSLIFWSKEIGWNASKDIDDKVEENMIKKVEELQTKMEKEETIDHINQYSVKNGTPYSSPDHPIIQGPFTNWHPMKMMKVEELALCYDKDEPDYIKIMHEEGQCSETKTEFKMLSVKERKTYEKHVLAYKRSFSYKWPKIIQKQFRWNKPNIVNLEELPTPEDLTTWNKAQYWVFPCMMKPGKNAYLVRKDPKSIIKVGYGNNETTDDDQELHCEPEYFSHLTQTPFRTEEIPAFVKQGKSHQKVRTFKKQNSVFKDWKEDDDKRIDAAFEHDTSHWKVPRFVKDPDEQKHVLFLIKKHFVTLKSIYIYYCSKSNFPYINFEEFRTFITDFSVLEKPLTNQILDNNFISAYSGVNDIDGT